MNSRPPYRLTPKTLDLLLRLHEQFGAVQALETTALNQGSVGTIASESSTPPSNSKETR